MERLSDFSNFVVTPITPVAPGDSAASAPAHTINACTVLIIPIGTPPEAECLIYAIHDDGVADTQFITIDPDTKEIKTLGPEYPGYDIESLELDPASKQLYAVVRKAALSGILVRVNPTTGALQQIGNTGTDGIVALSFRPTDNSLWAWDKNSGLVTIDTATAAIH